MIKTFIISILFFICVPAFAQWELGGSYNLRNEPPENGLGIIISRNLPFQWPLVGFKIRLGIELYRSSETSRERNSENKFLAEDYHLDLIGTFFAGKLNPYAGLLTGMGHQKINHFDENIFFAGIIAGIKLSFLNKIQPVFQIRIQKYFSTFDKSAVLKDISSLQFIGSAGIIFKFNTID